MIVAEDERKIAGANIRRLRTRSGLSLTGFAKELGIERTYFHDIENGTANPTFEKYEAIATALGVSVRDLLTEHSNGNGSSSSQKQAAKKKRRGRAT